MRDEVRTLFSDKTRYTRKRIISVALDDEILEALDEVVKEFKIARSDVCRKILRFHLIGTDEDEPISTPKPWATKKRARGVKLVERNNNLMKSFVEDGFSMKELMLKYDLSEKQIRKILDSQGVWDKDIAYPEKEDQTTLSKERNET